MPHPSCQHCPRKENAGDQKLPQSGQQRSQGCHSLWYKTIFINSADVLSQLPLISKYPHQFKTEAFLTEPKLAAAMGCCIQLLLPSSSSFAPTHPGTVAQRIPIIREVTSQAGERAARHKQCSCPQFFTFFLL